MDPKPPTSPAGFEGAAGLPGSPAGGASTQTLPDLLREEVDVSPELRGRILRQIDRVLDEGRRPVAAETLAVKPLKKGLLLPVLVNAVTAVVVVLGILGMVKVFGGGPSSAGLNSAGFQSAEGRLLEVFRSQSESRLQKQQSETLQAQERLRAAEGSLERRLRERESTLRRVMDAELASERERLQARGLAAAEVEAQLRALEAERQAALAVEVGQLRAGLRLQQLAEARDQERLTTDRIRAALALTLARLQDDDFTGARASLAAYRAVLREPAMQDNPGLRERLPVDLLLAEALARLVAPSGRGQVPAASAAVASLPAAVPAEAGESTGRTADPALAERLEAAESEAAALRTELARAQADLAEHDRQALGLEKDLRSGEAAADAEVSRLSGQLARATARVESLSQQVRRAEETAGRQGREEAFKEVIAFLDYMQGDPAKKQQLTAELTARARQDPLYAAVAREIQILAAGAGLGGSASPFRLLGTVSSAAAPGKVLVEPLVDLRVRVGARVQIRRASGLASEVLVARGIVQQSGAGGITVLLDAASKTVPEVMDAVYVEAGE